MSHLEMLSLLLFVTFSASVNRLLQSLLNPTGAILFHDRLYLNTLLSDMVLL